MKKTAILLLTVLLLLSSVSCTGGSRDEPLKNDAPYTFTDSEGDTFTLTEKPGKVAVLFSSYADIWVSAGGMVDVTVYETVERGFAAADAILVDSGAGHSSIDQERLVAAEPDLVIGTADYACQRDAVAFCRSVGIPAALFRVESFNDYLGVLQIFCSLTGHGENYTRYGTSVAQQIQKLKDSLPAGAAAPEFLFVRAGSSANSTKAKTTAEHFACAMLTELGAVNVADADSALSGTLSLELILEKNPDNLFITTMGDETAAMTYMQALLSSAGWRELDCVKAERYVFLPRELFHFKPNARWAEAYAYLLSVLYPESVYAEK